MDQPATTSNQAQEINVGRPSRKRVRTHNRNVCDSTVTESDSYASSVSCMYSTVSVSRQTRQKKKRKKQRTSHRQASTIQPREINKYFHNPVFHNCPTESDIGEELQGLTCQDILEDLVQDMHAKQFPFPSKDSEVLMKKITESAPTEIVENVKEIIQPLLEILKDVNFKDAKSTELVLSYNELKNLINYRYHAIGIYPILGYLQKFVAHALTGANPSGTHAELVHFWRFFLSLFQQYDEDEDTRYELRTNGDGLDLPVPVKFDDISREAVDEDYDEHTEPVENTFNIATKSDLLFSTKQLQGGYGSEFRCCAGDIKTTYDGLVTKRKHISTIESSGSSSDPSREYTGDSSGNSNVTDDDKPWARSRKSPTSNVAIGSSVKSVTTQLFMQIISLMKSQGDAGILSVQQVHGFGLYIVMHRVYVAAVHICKGDNDQVVDFAEKVAIAKCPGGTDIKKGFYRMVCFKYFNMFKVEHFKALTEFTKYLIYYQHKEKKLF